MLTNGILCPHCNVTGEHDDKPWDLEVSHFQTNQKKNNLEVQHEQFLRGYSIGIYWIYVTNKMNVFFVLENQ